MFFRLTSDTVVHRDRIHKMRLDKGERLYVWLIGEPEPIIVTDLACISNLWLLQGETVQRPEQSEVCDVERSRQWREAYIRWRSLDEAA